LSVALDAAIPNRAEPAGKPHSRDPYRASPILKELENILSGQLWILSKFPVLPTGKSFRGANPKRPVAGGQQTPYKVIRQILIRWRLPGDGPDAIEANQAEFRTQPEIAVGRLGNPSDGAFGKAVANLPRRVRVLTDVERRI